MTHVTGDVNDEDIALCASILIGSPDTLESVRDIVKWFRTAKIPPTPQGVAIHATARMRLERFR